MMLAFTLPLYIQPSGCLGDIEWQADVDVEDDER